MFYSSGKTQAVQGTLVCDCWLLFWQVFQMKSKPPVEEEKNHLTAVDCSFPAEIQQFPQMQVEQASLSFSEAYI